VNAYGSITLSGTAAEDGRNWCFSRLVSRPGDFGDVNDISAKHAESVM
jgi:hypothetical protein